MTTDILDDEEVPIIVDETLYKQQKSVNKYITKKRNEISWQTVLIIVLIICLFTSLTFKNCNDNDIDIESNETISKAAVIPTNFSRKELEAVRTIAVEMRNELEEYYSELDGNVLDSSWFVKAGTPEFALIENRMKGVFARAFVDDKQDVFTIGVIGSSVAAGHDNCAYDNFENQFQRYFSGVIEAAGMEFVINNAGEGGTCKDSERNQVYCIGQNAGQHSDIFLYSWTYFEARGDAVSHESAIRFALMQSDKQAPLHIFQTKSNIKHSIDPYFKYGANAMGLEDGLISGGKYNGKVWGQIGDGLHNTTRYGELVKEQERKDSLGVLWRNWHPGPLGNQFISDAFAYHYAWFVIQALDDIEKTWDSNGMNKAFALEPLFDSDLPRPVYCNATLCANDEPPSCLNFELPTFGNSNGMRVVTPHDSLSPYHGEIQDWEYEKIDNGDSFMVNKPDLKYMDISQCKFNDYCAGYTSKSASDGRLVVRLPKMKHGIIVLCGYGSPSMKPETFISNENVEIEFDGKVLDRNDWIEFSECIQIMNNWPSGGLNDSTGHLYLSIRLIGEDIPEESQIQIGQIITL